MATPDVLKKAEIGFLIRKDGPIPALVEDFRRAKPGETINIVDGEYEGPELYHPAVVRQEVLAAERGVRIKVVAGPILQTQPIIDAKLLGPQAMLEKVMEWVGPLVKGGFMTAQWAESEMGKHLKLTGFESMIRPFNRMIFYGAQEIDSQAVER